MQEDISAEVEDRIKAREEKRKRKEEKKRKRDSRDSFPGGQSDTSMAAADGSVKTSIKNSETEIQKSTQNKIGDAAELSAKASHEKESKKSKKKMEEADSDRGTVAASGLAEKEKPHKRRKK